MYNFISIQYKYYTLAKRVNFGSLAGCPVSSLNVQVLNLLFALTQEKHALVLAFPNNFYKQWHFSWELTKCTPFFVWMTMVCGIVIYTLFS